MNTKEAIEFLENTIYLQKKSDDIITYKKYNNLINEVIKLLQRGEIYEKTLGEVRKIYIGGKVVYIPKSDDLKSYSNGVMSVINNIERLEQKYFPKEATK